MRQFVRTLGLALAVALAACGRAEEAQRAAAQAEAAAASAAQEAKASAARAEARLAEARAAAALFADAAPERPRGRVVDSATAQPWPDAWVRLQGTEGEPQVVRATATGHFLAESALPAGEVRVSCGLDPDGPWCPPGEQVVDHDPALPEPTVHVVRVEPGPSYSLAFLEAAASEPARWEARVVERAQDGTFRPWSWQVLRPGDPPRLRYLQVERSHDAQRTAFVELRLRYKDWFARAAVPSTRGVQVEPVALELVQYGSFGGVVRDTNGEPLREMEVRLYPESGSETPRVFLGPVLARTDGEGAFRFDGVEPGHHDLHLRPEGLPEVHVHVDVEGGHADGAVYEVAALEGLVDLPLAIIGSGVEEDAPEAVVSLRSLDDPTVRRSLHTRMQNGWLAQTERVGVGVAGIFAGLPPSRYELEVFGLDGRRYEPASIEVDASALEDGVAFSLAPLDPLFEWAPEVRAAGTEQPFEAYGLHLSSPAWWFPSGREIAAGESAAWLGPNVPASSWRLWRDGFRPRWGSSLSWSSEQDLPGVIELDPGWGCELIFRDASSARLPLPREDSWSRAALVRAARPLADVELFADGERVGRSDDQGRFRLQLDRPPGRLELRLDGWRALDAWLTGEVDREDPTALAREGSAVVWFEPVR